MTADEIIALIKNRREKFFDAQILGTADDPPVASQAGVYRAISDEYDDLLAEIEGTLTHK